MSADQRIDPACGTCAEIDRQASELRVEVHTLRARLGAAERALMSARVMSATLGCDGSRLSPEQIEALADLSASLFHYDNAAKGKP